MDKNKLLLVLLIALMVSAVSGYNQYSSKEAEYPFFNGIPAEDVSGNNHDLSGTGGVLTSVPGISKDQGDWDYDNDSSFEAYGFNGDQYLNGSVPSGTFDGDKSITGWMYFNSSELGDGNTKAIFSTSDPGFAVWRFRVVDGFFQLQSCSPSASTCHTAEINASNFENQKWIYFAGVINDTNSLRLSVWENSTSNYYNDTVSTSDDMDSGEEFFIGANNQQTNYISGRLDEVKIFTKPLNDKEVYNSYFHNNINSSTTNSAPSASFTVSESNLTVDVDASGSSDSDGSISTYEWDWTNDGTYEDTGKTASHTYDSQGDYTITLKVTDDDGATDTVSKTVSVSSGTNPNSFLWDWHSDESVNPILGPDTPSNNLNLELNKHPAIVADTKCSDATDKNYYAISYGYDSNNNKKNLFLESDNGYDWEIVKSLGDLGSATAYAGCANSKYFFSFSGHGSNTAFYSVEDLDNPSVVQHSDILSPSQSWEEWSRTNSFINYTEAFGNPISYNGESYNILAAYEGGPGSDDEVESGFAFCHELNQSMVCDKPSYNPVLEPRDDEHDSYVSGIGTIIPYKNDTVRAFYGANNGTADDAQEKFDYTFFEAEFDASDLSNVVNRSTKSAYPSPLPNYNNDSYGFWVQGGPTWPDEVLTFGEVRNLYLVGGGDPDNSSYDAGGTYEGILTYIENNDFYVMPSRDVRFSVESNGDTKVESVVTSVGRKVGLKVEPSASAVNTSVHRYNSSASGFVGNFTVEAGSGSEINISGNYSNSSETIKVSTGSWDDTTAVNSNGEWSLIYGDDADESFSTKTFTVETSEAVTDTTPPTSSDNWTFTGFVDKSEVPIELSASDNDGGKGVKEISYRTCKDSDCSIPIRDWTTVSGSSVDLLLGSFNSDEKGNVTVQYNATDNAGNVEASNKEYVAFEKGKSAINLSTPLDGDVFSLDNSSSTLVDFNGSIENDNFVLKINLYLNGAEVESVSPDNGVKPNFNFSRDLGEANHTYSIEWKSGYTGKFYRSDPVSFEVANSSNVVQKNVLEACSSVDESTEFCLENGTSPVGFDSGFTPRDNTSISYNVSAPSSSTGSSVFYGFANSSSTGFSTVESGNVTVSVEENTSGNNAPSASFTANSTSVLTGESIEFDASGSSDIDGSISSYSWDFGDSSTVSGEVVTHSYSSTGDYVVELTVTDDDGVSTSVNTTVSVSSDSDSGGGGGGGGDTGGDDSTDDNTSTGGTAGLGNISAGLQSPHVDANYFFETFSVKEGTSQTLTLDGVESTFELVDAINKSYAALRKNGLLIEVSEGEIINIDDDEVAVSDVIDNGNESQIVLSLKDDQNQGSNQGEVIFFYNYSTSSSDEYNVSVQYRETGIGKDWKTAENTTVNSVEDNTQASVTVSSLKESIYEARVVVENGTDNVSTTPVGFAVGYVPEIDLVAPPNNAEVTRSPPVTTLPIAFTARTIESTDFGGFYVGPSGERYSAGELIEENLRINGSSSDTLDFKLSGALGFFEWLPFFTVNEYGSFVDAFGIPGGTDFFAEFDMSVPVQEGTYTAYVNASSNDTSFSFNTTSSGRSVLLNVKDLENSNRTTEISNSFEQDTGKTVTNDPVTDESFNSSQTFDNETYYFSSPAVLLRGPRGNYTLDDLSSGEINFNFAMSHEGQFLANRTVVIEANDSVVDKIGLETDDTEYDFNISGSQLNNGSWNEQNYSYFVQFENSTDVIWSSEGRTDGELSFQVEEASERPELTGNFFEDLLIVLNPLTYGQTVATVVSLLLTVLTGILLRNYREVALAGMVSTLIATVALGWTPTWIGLIIFIGGFLVFSDKAGRVIG